jgi:signal transduction histidine kinase
MSTGKLRILLVEDDDDDYTIIRRLLSRIPGTVFSMNWVTGYQEAMAVLERDRYDLCLLDYRLGAHDGLELLNESGKKGWNTPIIFLTGQGEYDVDLQAMRLGAADYLVKDHLTASLLERSIRYTLERETSRKALQEAYEDLEARVREKTADLAEANQELKRESEKVKLFAYSVSHDLKNPAISLYGLTKRLFENYGEVLDEKGQAYCRHIMQSARQIATLTERINMFIASKEAPVNMEEVDLGEALACIRNEFWEQLQSRHIYWSEPESLPVVRVDRVSLERVFRNLVDNTLKYGGEGLKEIRIGFRETERFWILSVSDDGVGIRTEHADTVFGRFMRVGSWRKTEGLGLGLAIVKEIAGRHKGEVWAEAGPLGGTSISVSFSKGM